MQGRIEAPGDGIGRQFLPDVRELSVSPAEIPDPIGDASRSPVEGLVHRYPDRVLLMPTLLCPVYCRFCFRREVVGDAGRAVLAPDRLQAAIAYIRDRPAVREVILTGGDPLVLSTARLQAILEALAAIEHVAVVRFHTRVPLVAPERVTRDLVSILRIRPAVWGVIHANHPREITPEGTAALAALVDAGIPLLGQTVLLRGVNDDEETLAQLMWALVERRVKPYYLHHLDLAEGTGHFRVSVARGRALVEALRGRISGLCQPTYVLDIPGGHGKVPIGPSYLHESAGAYQVKDPWGGVHAYVDLADRER
jgi:lysine 2,3-aminomutase